MKTKHLIIVTLFCLLGISNANATFVRIEKHNGGIFGYKDIQYTQNGADKWLYCNDPGWSRCKSNRPIPGEEGNNLDAVDIKYLYDLIDYADEKIDNSVLIGTYYIRIHVEGENCDRYYLVTWNYSDPQNGITTSERLADICN